MPGHSAAFIRAFRHDMQSKEGMAILKLLMDEVCEVFEEVPYLHIGTDEVKFTNPKFVPEMVAYIRAKGKQVISGTRDGSTSRVRSTWSKCGVTGERQRAFPQSTPVSIISTILIRSPT